MPCCYAAANRPITLTGDSADAALAVQHNLLSRALQVLTDPDARADIAASLDLLLRVVAVVPSATLIGPEDPWLYFYEDFLAAYDPDLREKAGAYYTPVEVVRAQVRLIEDLHRQPNWQAARFRRPRRRYTRSRCGNRHLFARRH